MREVVTAVGDYPLEHANPILKLLDPGILPFTLSAVAIGRRGETLASIQYLVRLMINQRIKRWKNIVVDVEQYKERRVNQLTQLAKRMADQVSQSGRAVSRSSWKSK